MPLPLRILVCLPLFLGLTAAASAKGHNHHSDGGGGGNPGGNTGAFEWVPPADWPAAAQINIYLGAYLQNSILAPLDSATPSPRTALSAMNVDFTAHLAAAETPTERALYSNAVNACNVVARVLDQREQEQSNLVQLNHSSNAVNPLDRPAYAVSGRYSWNLEDERARAQYQQEIQAQLANLDRRNSYVSFSLKHWSDQVGQFRQAIQTAAINVTTAQVRFDREMAAAAHPAAPVAPAKTSTVASATAQPTSTALAPVASKPALAPEPSANASSPVASPASSALAASAPPATMAVAPADADPAAGNWWTEKGSPLALRADHTTGGRDGNWVYTCTTNSGRNYELRWKNKHWTDYVVLSADGRTLNGKGNGKSVAYYRQ